METTFCIRCGDEMVTDVVSLCDECLKQLHIDDNDGATEKVAGRDGETGSEAT